MSGQIHALEADLMTLLGERVVSDQNVRAAHGADPSHHTPALPDLVVYPRSTHDVAEIVRSCAARRVPMIPYGLGTSLEGHIIPTRGGVSVDLSQMNRILSVNSDDMDCRVEAGVTQKLLNEHLAGSGLFFPAGPGVECSLGGMTATGASGTNAVRYGTIRSALLGLTVVMADGSIIQTGTRARKSSAGYNLTQLFAGSEGTLGIITEVQLRLYALPPAIRAAVCSFSTLDDAVRTAIAAIRRSIPVARVELLDHVQMDAVNRYSGLDHPAQPTLFLEFHGTERSVAEQVSMFGSIAAEHGAGDFQWAEQADDRARLWQARHDAYYAALALRPGSVGWVTDVCVPISQLARCIAETQADVADSGLVAPIVGHVGDGNFHLVYVMDPDDPGERTRVVAHNDRLITRALEMGGTCTGEHGVGLGKMSCLEQEHGAAAVEVMRQIKHSLDPANLMNPGKIVPAAPNTPR